MKSAENTDCRKGRLARLTAIAAAISLMIALHFVITPGQAVAGQVTLAWNMNTEPEVSRYNLYHGTTPGTYAVPINVGNVTKYTVVNLADGQSYFFALTAVDTFGNESGYSKEVAYTTPGAVVTPEIGLFGNAVSIVNRDTTPSVADFTNFGNTDITTGTVTRTFTIRNTGSGALTLSGAPIVTVSGTNAADFVVTHQPVSPVAAGGSTSFQVRFDPSAAGKRVATLTIANSDADENPFRLAVQGAGTAPEIGLLGNAATIVDGDTTPAAADHTDFGGADILAGTVTRIFTIRNMGSGALTLSGAPLVAVSGPNAADFKVTVQPPSSVAAGASATFQVTFDPGALGTRVATLIIANNDLNENPYDFAVKGAGANLPEIKVTGNAANIAHRSAAPSFDDHTDFGSTNIAGGMVTHTFTIRNTGTKTLSLTSKARVIVGGANARDFKVTVLPPSSVAAAESTSFQVCFDPRAAGTRVAKLTIANNDADENPYSFAIQGTGITPEINLVGNAISIGDGDTTPAAADHTDFGGTNIAGGTITRTFTIQNTGSDTLTLSGAPLVAVGGTNAADFTVTALPATTVAVAGSTTFQVRFDPSTVGTRVATLTVANNDASENPYNFALRGTGTTPEIILSGNARSIVAGDTTPAAADHSDFGGTDIAGGTITRTFTIRNTGSAALILSDTPRVRVSGTNAADFVVTSLPASPVAAGVSTTFQVRFDPRAAGTRVATLTIANNDADENPYDFALQGAGTIAPEINLVGNAMSIVDSDATPAAADHTDFGGTSIAGGTITRTFTIRNTGSDALILSGTPLVAVGGTNAADFKVTTLPAATIAAGGSTSFQVRFDPSAAGTRVATLTIANNDSNENPYDFALRGAGTTPEILLSGNAVSIVDGDTTPAAADHSDFGGTDIAGGTITRTFTIRNTGTAALTLPGTPRVAVGGTNAADFTVTTPPANTVAVAGSTTFFVRFDPSEVGTRVATLTIANNDAKKNPYNFALRGTGTIAPAATTITVAETIAKPTAPSGPTNLSAGVTYIFSTAGASSSNGDAVQYRFSWSDGTASEWLPVGILEATKSWATAGTYTQVQVQARCATHPSVISPVSAPLTVTVAAVAVVETLSQPATPAGAASLSAMTASVYRTGSAVSSSGDALQYRFHWSDGTMSQWLPVGVLEASKSWSSPGSYEVRAEARCALHPAIVSSFSPPLLVGISPGIDEILSGPALPIGPGNGQTGFVYAFDAGGASSSSGDPVQYRFQWGDGTTSDWVTAEEGAHVRALKFWPTEGRYAVTAEVRCSVHPELTIPSATAEVQIVLGDPEMFFDTFAVGAVGDTRWQVVSGGWVVNPDETFATDSPQSDNRAIVGTIPAFTAGRLTTRLRLASGATNYSAGIIFSYTDAAHYRYVALTGSDLYLGQVGETATEPDGIKVSVPMSVDLDTWHQLRVDVHPDGEIKTYFGQLEVPALTFRFGDHVVGQVGCATNTSKVSFDDFGIWDERVLIP